MCPPPLHLSGDLDLRILRVSSVEEQDMSNLLGERRPCSCVQRLGSGLDLLPLVNLHLDELVGEQSRLQILDEVVRHPLVPHHDDGLEFVAKAAQVATTFSRQLGA